MAREAVFLITHVAVFLIRDDGVVLKEKGGVRTVQSVCNKGGYLYCKLTLAPKVMKSIFPHIEVAKAFIPNPLNLPEVNHVDGNKHNIGFKNLEWMDRRQQVVHAFKSGLHGEKTSRFNGVSKIVYKSGSFRWRAIVMVKGRNSYLGSFRDEEVAAQVVDDFVIALGLSSPLNFPRTQMPVEKFTYLKDDGTSSNRTLLLTEAPPKSTVMTLDLTGLEDSKAGFLVSEHEQYQAAVAEHMKKMPTFKAYLEEKYPGQGHNPPFKSFKRDGLSKV